MSLTVTGWAIAVDLTGGSDARTFYWYNYGNSLNDTLYSREAAEREARDRRDWEKSTRWRNPRPVRVTITIDDPTAQVTGDGT